MSPQFEGRELARIQPDRETYPLNTGPAHAAPPARARRAAAAVWFRAETDSTLPGRDRGDAAWPGAPAAMASGPPAAGRESKASPDPASRARTRRRRERYPRAPALASDRTAGSSARRRNPGDPWAN